MPVARPKLLVDLDVFLDVILQREKLLADSAAVLAMIENERAEGYVSGHAITTIYYLVRKANGPAAAAAAISDV